MRQRLFKYAKRLLIVLLVLGLIAVAVFTWLLFWPLEGDVEDILALVPEDVEFVLRCDYDDLKRTDWAQQNVFQDPLVPAMGVQAKRALDQIDLELQTIQAQFSQQSPVEIDVKSWVEENVLAGEVCIAGNFWQHSSPRRGEPPQWKELLVLKRVSWLARGVSGLQHDFIREQIQPGPGVELTAESDRIWKFKLPQQQPVSRERRPGDPDMTQWYMARVLDVIAVTNNRELIDNVLALGEDPDGRSFARRPGFEIPQTPGRIHAAVNLEPMRKYLHRTYDFNPNLAPLRRFLPPEALTKMSGHISLESTELLRGGARISFIASDPDSEAVQRHVYGLPQREVASGIAELVPAKDTFAVLSLRATPEYLLNKVVWGAFPEETRKLYKDNLRENPQAGFSTVEEFFDDLSTRIGDEAMVALGRMSNIYDRVDFPEWYSEEPAPIPAMAIMVRLGEGATQAELEQYLSEKVFILGLDGKLDRITHGDYTYSRGALKIETLDYKYVRPCFAVVSNHLVMTTTEGYMRQIIDTVRDPSRSAMAQDETFRATMGSLPDRGHLGLFVDIEKLTRVPASIRWNANDPKAIDMGAPGTRGFLWDMRNDWVINEKDDYAESVRYRAEVRRQYPAGKLSPQQEDEIDKRVDDYIENQWLARYGDFLEEYRKSLEDLRRLRSFGLVLGAVGPELDARFVSVFRQAETSR